MFDMIRSSVSYCKFNARKKFPGILSKSRVWPSGGNANLKDPPAKSRINSRKPFPECFCGLCPVVFVLQCQDELRYTNAMFVQYFFVWVVLVCLSLRSVFAWTLFRFGIAKAAFSTNNRLLTMTTTLHRDFSVILDGFLRRLPSPGREDSCKELCVCHSPKSLLSVCKCNNFPTGRDLVASAVF